MFGKPNETDDTDTMLEEFFGDEAAAANAVEVRALHQRVDQVESQISSQFTSLATYAQIAQEQVELARAEAKSATERSEQRVTSLVERERADRISSFTGEAPAGTAPDVMARLDAVEHSVAQIRKGLDECMQRQKSLAEAITVMFERLAASTASNSEVAEPTQAAAETTALHEAGEPTTEATFEPARLPTPFAPPSLPAPMVQSPVSPLTGPIADLSLNA